MSARVDLVIMDDITGEGDGDDEGRYQPVFVTCTRCGWKQFRKLPEHFTKGGARRYKCRRCKMPTQHTYQLTEEKKVLPADNDRYVVPVSLPPPLTEVEAGAVEGDMWVNAVIHRDLMGHQLRQKSVPLRTPIEKPNGKRALFDERWDYFDESAQRWKPILPFTRNIGEAWHMATSVTTDRNLAFEVYTFNGNTEVTVWDADDVEVVSAHGEYPPLVLCRAMLALYGSEIHGNTKE